MSWPWDDSYCWWKKSCTGWVVKNHVNNAINYQPQLVCRISSINSSCESFGTREKKNSWQLFVNWLLESSWMECILNIMIISYSVLQILKCDLWRWSSRIQLGDQKVGVTTSHFPETFTAPTSECLREEVNNRSEKLAVNRARSISVSLGFSSIGVRRVIPSLGYVDREPWWS